MTIKYSLEMYCDGKEHCSIRYYIGDQQLTLGTTRQFFPSPWIQMAVHQWGTRRNSQLVCS